LGFASLLQRDLLRANLQLERALQAMPRHVESWHALGWTRLLLGDGSGALAAFREGLGCDPDSAESHAAMALALWFCGDKEEANRHLHMATQLDPDCAIARQARALITGEPADLAKLDAVTRQVLAQWTRRP
jgi:cytochrome c-type biogenesis protein CcmH/NrfG